MFNFPVLDRKKTNLIREGSKKNIEEKRNIEPIF